MKNFPYLIIDSREKTPWVYNSEYKTIRKKLDVGDYSLDGYETRVSIERKNIFDMVSCCSNRKPERNRERFKRMLDKMQHYEFRAVIIEGSLTMLMAGSWRGTMRPASVLGSIISWSQRYRIPFFFGDNPQRASYLCLAILKTAHNSFSQKFQKEG